MVRETENFCLIDRNTFRMNVSCGLFLEYDSIEDLAGLDFSSLPRPVIHIGGGSNLLFKGDFPGTVLHSRIKYCNIAADHGDDVLVEVGAGVVFDDFCAWVADKGLWGAEKLSGIPGEVGAAAVQNIGAYGADVKDIITQVKCFNRETGRVETLSVAQCDYGYRDSVFKHSPAKESLIVLSVLFRLSRVAGANLAYKGLRDAFEGKEPWSPGEVRRKVLEIRDSKLPDPAQTGSAGSFFKNPVVSAEVFAAMDDSVPHYVLEDGSVKLVAAWLIDRCGLKGESVGGARIWHKQPLVIVNATGDATPSDILALEEKIKTRVKERFGVDLTPEVEHI